MYMKLTVHNGGTRPYNQAVHSKVRVISR